MHVQIPEVAIQVITLAGTWLPNTEQEQSLKSQTEPCKKMIICGGEIYLGPDCHPSGKVSVVRIIQAYVIGYAFIMLNLNVFVVILFSHVANEDFLL